MTSRFLDGLEVRPYVTQSTHQYLAEGSGRLEGPNIGKNGEHLTITFLSLNRSSLSQRLCDSIVNEIPEFSGEILAIDNGSSDEEFEKLSSYLSKLPLRTRIVKLGKNFGVAGGRNRTIPEIRTPWAMFLDNDIYFTRSPFEQIQADIASLGCHFLSVPLLNEDSSSYFLRGGHLWLSLSGGELVIGGGGASRADELKNEYPGYLTTFMPGGACVLRVDSFQRLGGYDEGMFIGFEDFEFSLRIFRAGMKVGSSDIRALVHDHAKPDTSDDKQYERARFARERLVEAARHFERKHGFKVWTPGVDDWVAQRERELEIANPAAPNAASQSNRKPRIALIVDVRFWALANVADQIVKNLSNDFEFEVMSYGDVHHKPDLLANLTRDFDLTHYLWREPLWQIAADWRKESIRVLFGDWPTFLKENFAKPRTFSVYDHLFLKPHEISERAQMFRDLATAYTVSSKKLDDIYRNIPEYPAPSGITSDGVDLSAFRPRELGRLQELTDRPLRVGWVGNSKWGDDVFDDPKGFHSILLPAIASLQAQEIAITPVFADRQIGFIPHAKMPTYYSNIDVLVCTSLVEGTPNPVLEAMACGVPIISTDVGIVPEALGKLQSDFILPERSITALSDALARLNRNPGLAQALSEENLRSIVAWDWPVRTEAFRSFFHQVLAKAAVSQSD